MGRYQDPSLTAGWVRINALDPIYRLNEMIEVWLDAAVECVIKGLEEKGTRLKDLHDPDFVPLEHARAMCETEGQILIEDASSEDHLRRLLRHSMAAWKWRGAEVSYRIVFAAYNWHVQIRPIMLDRFGIYSTLPLLDIVDGGHLWDETGLEFDEDGVEYDTWHLKAYFMPADHADEYLTSLWGRTSFYTIQVYETSPFTQHDTIGTRIGSLRGLVEPLHTRLLVTLDRTGDGYPGYDVCPMFRDTATLATDDLGIVTRDIIAIEDQATLATDELTVSVTTFTGPGFDDGEPWDDEGFWDEHITQIGLADTGMAASDSLVIVEVPVEIESFDSGFMDDGGAWD